MNGTIKVNTSKLTSTASSFSSIGSQIKNTTSQMVSIASALSGEVWSGDAATAYTSKLKGLQADIKKIISMVNEHATDLQQMAQEFEKAESSNASTASALASNVIS